MLESKVAPSITCDQMMSVVEKLDNQSLIKLGSDLAVFIGLCLSVDKINLIKRASVVCASIGAQINEVLKILLARDNVDLFLEQPNLLAQVLHDVVKFYGTNKDFE